MPAAQPAFPTAGCANFCQEKYARAHCQRCRCRACGFCPEPEATTPPLPAASVPAVLTTAASPLKPPDNATAAPAVTPPQPNLTSAPAASNSTAAAAPAEAAAAAAAPAATAAPVAVADAPPAAEAPAAEALTATANGNVTTHVVAEEVPAR